MHVPSFHQSAAPGPGQAPWLWLLAGTGEGPRLAAALLQAGWLVRVSVVSRAAARAYPPPPRLQQLTMMEQIPPCPPPLSLSQYLISLFGRDSRSPRKKF
jgi:hypothetical protein